MISCNVISDILPLYIDGAVSEDTKKLVEEHLKGCEKCRREAGQMGDFLVLPEDSELLSQEAEVLRRSVSGLEERVRARMMFFAAVFDLLLNLAMPFFVKWVRDIYLSVQSAEAYKGLESVMSREMLNGQWNLAEISGYCLFFGAADIFCMAGTLRRRGKKVAGRRLSEPLVMLSYVFKAAALVVFLLVEVF